MKNGFTLLELIVVVIIIGILATLGLTQYTRVVERSRGAEAKAGLGTVRRLLSEYYLEKGTLEGINSDYLADHLPRSCNGTSYFWYRLNPPMPTSVDVRADRCKSGGKTPDWGGGNYCLGGKFNATTSAITGTCGCGDGCTELGYPWDF